MPEADSTAIRDPTRLSALRRLSRVDATSSGAFDRLTRIAAAVLEAPTALVTLVGTDRQIFAGCAGLSEPLASERSTPLSHSFCQHAVVTREPLIIENASEHPLVFDNPAIREYGVMAYAGIPLITRDGHALGSFCVLDQKPRSWSEQQISVLRDLAASVMTEIELHFRVASQIRSENILRAEQRALEAIGRGTPLPEVLDLIAREVESASEDVRCAVFVCEQQNTVLRLAAAPTLPASYTRPLLLREVTEGGGPCTHAVLHNEDALVTDAATDSMAVEARETMLAHGIRSGWSYPIRGGDGAVLGTFAVTSSEAREPEPGEVEVFRRAASLAAIALERSATEERLRVQERSLASLLEGVVVTDPMRPDMPILYVNDAFEGLTGYPPEEALGRNCRFLQGAGTDPGTVAEIRTAIAECGSYTGEVLNYRKDGTSFWNRLSIRPVSDDRGAATHFVGVLQDVTRQREAEQALAAAEAHYRRVVTASPQAIYALDAAGRFIELNPAGERVLAQPQRDVLGRHFAEVVAPRDLPAAEKAFQDLLTRAVSEVELECHIIQPSGAERLVSITVTRFETDGQVSALHGIARDITEEKEAEQHLRRTERLAAAGTLLAGVAHELNNPLAAIKGFASLMLMEERTQEDREALDTMQREADRAAKIVAHLRVLARQGDEAEESPLEPVDVNDVIRHVLRVRAYSIQTRSIHVREDLATSLPPVLGRRGELEQVVLNLVVNAEQALESIPADRRLIVRTRPTREGVSLHIVDLGPGIPSEHLERIFDPFFTTKAVGEGTGLGLSLIHRLVTEHGGLIRVESEAGKGAAFMVDLPRAPTATSHPPPVRPILHATRSLRVLVVDDESGIRKAVVRYLGRRGHLVDQAPDGGAALRLIEEGRAGTPYDVILSDLRMPGLGGDELLAHLRRTDESLARRLIFFTGDASSGASARILAEAGVPVVVKPFELESLAALVEQQADG